LGIPGVTDGNGDGVNYFYEEGLERVRSSGIPGVIIVNDEWVGYLGDYIVYTSWSSSGTP